MDSKVKRLIVKRVIMTLLAMVVCFFLDYIFLNHKPDARKEDIFLYIWGNITYSLIMFSVDLYKYKKEKRHANL